MGTTSLKFKCYAIFLYSDKYVGCRADCGKGLYLMANDSHVLIRVVHEPIWFPLSCLAHVWF